MIKNILCCSILIITTAFVQAQKAIKLTPVKQVSIKVSEPSDICYSPKSDTFFVVSDNGILFEVDRNGKAIRKLNQKDTDFEAVYCNDKNVYAVDESGRTIYEYDIQTLKLVNSTYIAHNGPRNKGFESFTFDASRNKFLLITESDPILVFELDTNLNVTKKTDISTVASDISSARFYKDSLYLLSDEEMLLIKVNPITYEVIKKWTLPVINPEGLAFDKDGNILITCDDMQRLYYFNNPEKL